MKSKGMKKGIIIMTAKKKTSKKKRIPKVRRAEGPSQSSTVHPSTKPSSPASAPSVLPPDPPVEEPRVEELSEEEMTKLRQVTSLSVRRPRSDASETPSPTLAVDEEMIGPIEGICPSELAILASVTERLTPHAVAMILRNLCQNAYYCYGNYQDWRSDDGRYLPDKVLEMAVNAEFQLRAWPKVKVILKENYHNADWTMQVMVCLALHEVLQRMADVLFPPPTSTENGNDARVEDNTSDELSEPASG